MTEGWDQPEFLEPSEGTIIGEATAEHWDRGDGDTTSDGISDSIKEQCWLCGIVG